MCRLFALRANQPTCVRGSLLLSPTSLDRQSVCDLRCQSHDNGWGIGYYVRDEARRLRSERPAHDDQPYRELAETVASQTVLAHIRRASIGTVAVRNSHPFMYGRWLFAHNGTLFGFPKVRERLRGLIPAALLSSIEGDTDSEHAFHLVLGRLEHSPGPLGPAEVCRAVAETIRLLHDLCPGEDGEVSQFNFVLTDGRLLVASRWGHTLSWLRRRGRDPSGLDGPLEEQPDYQAVAIASEPTTAEAWSEVPDRTLLCVKPDFTVNMMPLG
ncbi:MAG TPA: class II glutamine amidotransferase [Gemmataceae bacterium]|jgi:glutamine amidotransferase|nr:class II glutamine amidotransferase [Gemmataceae bacterium]